MPVPLIERAEVVALRFNVSDCCSGTCRDSGAAGGSKWCLELLSTCGRDARDRAYERELRRFAAARWRHSNTIRTGLNLGSRVSGCPAQGLESGSACASVANRRAKHRRIRFGLVFRT
jgi:hypothetical protein